MKKIFLILLLLSLAPGPLNAREPKPLLEAGVLAAQGSTADYPASDQVRSRFLPAPYLIYRGRILKSDNDEGTRFQMLELERFNLDLSLSGSFPASGNEARAGMPDLDWTLELGPRLLYYFVKDTEKFIRAGLPLRAAFATDFSTTRHIGFTLAPALQADFFNLGLENLTLYLESELIFLNRGQAGYFYDVDAAFAAPERPAYRAKEGFLGYDLSLSFKYNTEKTLWLTGARYADYTQSVNAGGPLHRKGTEWIYFVAVGWMLFESDEREEYFPDRR